MVVKGKSFLFNILVPLAIGLISELIALPFLSDYAELNLPRGAPTILVSTIVWIFVFILMGIASYLVFSSKQKNIGLPFWIYYIQLAFVFFWPIFFYHAQFHLFSIIWIFLELLFSFFAIFTFSRIRKLAGLIMIPCFIWISFLAYVTIGVFVLN